MPSRLGEIEELRLIQEALKNFPTGALLEEILQIPGINHERRTLQRRLQKLRLQGLIELTGKGKSTRYLLAKPIVAARQEKPTIDNILSLSQTAKHILTEVTRPPQARTPVGYNRIFLDRYRPNTDFYLTADERKKLAEIGTTGRLAQPAGTYARNILGRLLIDLSWNSSRLEGNTYSLLDTQQLIANGQPADHKSALEAQMILNHKDAIEFIVDAAQDIRFNRYTILNLHAMLSNNLLSDPSASGRLRTIPVNIGGSVFIPLAIPQLIDELFGLLLDKAEKIEDPFEQAFFVMVQLPYLQPFDDVNKRVSRLAANIPLIRNNQAPLSFVDVPNDLYLKGMLGVYELQQIDLLKEVFLWAYERSSLLYAAVRQSLGDPDPFRLQYRDRIRSLIQEIVSNALPRANASALIKQQALSLPQQDQTHFIEAVENELLSLHEGNFARYRVRPAEFQKWKTAWE